MTKRSSQKKITDYLLVYKVRLLIVFLMLMITSSAVLIMSHSVGHVIDQAVATGDKDRLDSTLFYFSLITVVLAIATGLRFFFISSTGEYVIRDIRRDLYFKILELYF